MLTKSKSKQINLLKYALLIPLVTGMLIYSACSVQNEMANSSQELGEYTFTLDFNEITEDMYKANGKFQDFLYSNPEYVGWVNFDETAKTFVHSIHSKEEKVPEGYRRLSETNQGTNSHRLFVNYPKNVILRTLSTSNKSSRKYLNNIDVPFGVIEQVPIFPGCEALEKDSQRDCMSKNISQFVNKNFNTKIADSLGLAGRQRINVIFKIDTLGNVTQVRCRAPHPALEKEAVRVIKSLPKMIPGKQKGKKVNVPYSLPIVFQVANVQN